jgi:hypothetical protein
VKFDHQFQITGLKVAISQTFYIFDGFSSSVEVRGRAMVRVRGR